MVEASVAASPSPRLLINRHGEELAARIGWNHPRKLAAMKILPPWQFAWWKNGCWVRKKLCVRGYHIYNIWEAAVGKMPLCVRDPMNAHDSYAAAGGNYLWWKIFRGFNFRGWGDPQKFQHNENFCVYGSKWSSCCSQMNSLQGS